MTRACRPQRSRHADRERDAWAATAFRSEQIRASARSREANEDEIWVPRGVTDPSRIPREVRRQMK